MKRDNTESPRWTTVFREGVGGEGESREIFYLITKSQSVWLMLELSTPVSVHSSVEQVGPRTSGRNLELCFGHRLPGLSGWMRNPSPWQPPLPPVKKDSDYRRKGITDPVSWTSGVSATQHLIPCLWLTALGLLIRGPPLPTLMGHIGPCEADPIPPPSSSRRKHMAQAGQTEVFLGSTVGTSGNDRLGSTARGECQPGASGRYYVEEGSLGMKSI